MDEKNAVPSKKPTTVSQRFNGFAVCHLAYSLLSLIPAFCVYMKVVEAPFLAVTLWLLPVVLIALYFPMGMLAAWVSEWTPPRTLRERWLAIALPTLAAWLWVVFVLVCIVGEWGDLFMLVLALSFLLAAPSSLFVVTLCGWSLLLGNSGLVALGVCGLIAGALPPLLFALGSFWQAERKQKKEDTES